MTRLPIGDGVTVEAPTDWDSTSPGVREALKEADVSHGTSAYEMVVKLRGWLAFPAMPLG